MIKPKKQISPEKAKVRLEELCARSEQCTGDAYKKLQTWGIACSDAETIVKSLADRRFIDDERFCHAFVRDKMRFARWGRRKIKAALMMKRLDSAIAAKALEAVDEDEYIESLQTIIRLKSASMPDAETYEGRTRLFRFAASRGFEPDLISRILRERSRQED